MPALHTIVDGGSVGRPVGQPVTDHVTAAGLAASTAYRLTVSLQDATGLACGTATDNRRTATAPVSSMCTPASVAACGGGSDTFAERLTVGTVTAAVSPPGQPAETFPVTPTIETAVAGGNAARAPGTKVIDHIRLTGLPRSRCACRPC